jgi:hypothetical protein
VKALERMAVLDQHVAMMCRHGFAKTADVDPFTVDIREVRQPLPRLRHRVYLVLSLLSFGLGAILWLAVACDRALRSRRLGREPFHAGTWRIHVGVMGEVETYEILSEWVSGSAPSGEGELHDRDGVPWQDPLGLHRAVAGEV